MRYAVVMSRPSRYVACPSPDTYLHLRGSPDIVARVIARAHLCSNLLIMICSRMMAIGTPPLRLSLFSTGAPTLRSPSFSRHSKPQFHHCSKHADQARSPNAVPSNLCHTRLKAGSRSCVLCSGRTRREPQETLKPHTCAVSPFVLDDCEVASPSSSHHPAQAVGRAVRSIVDRR